jgi:hypothetical protein
MAHAVGCDQCDAEALRDRDKRLIGDRLLGRALIAMEIHDRAGSIADRDLLRQDDAIMPPSTTQPPSAGQESSGFNASALPGRMSRERPQADQPPRKTAVSQPCRRLSAMRALERRSSPARAYREGWLASLPGHGLVSVVSACDGISRIDVPPSPGKSASALSLAELETQLRPVFIAALAGDAAAYRLFLDTISTRLRGYLRQMLARAGRTEASEAEDVLQETLLALHLSRHTYDPASPVTAWAHAIARYKLVDHLRRSGRHAGNLPIDDEAHQLAVRPTARPPRPGSIWREPCRLCPSARAP